MLNYPRTDVLMTTARIALFFTLLFSYPVLLHPTRAAINRLVLYCYALGTGCYRSGCGRRRSGEGEGERERGGEGEDGGKVNSEKEEEAISEVEDVKNGVEKVPLLRKTNSTTTTDDVKVTVCMNCARDSSASLTSIDSSDSLD